MRFSSSASIAAPMSATASAASRTPPQNPSGPRCSMETSEYAMNAPSMYSDPCAKLTTRVTPKINVRPAATRNSADAPARPFRSWAKKEAKDTRERNPWRAVSRYAGLPMSAKYSFRAVSTSETRSSIGTSL